MVGAEGKDNGLVNGGENNGIKDWDKHCEINIMSEMYSPVWAVERCICMVVEEKGSQGAGPGGVKGATSKTQEQNVGVGAGKGFKSVRCFQKAGGGASSRELHTDVSWYEA